MVEDLKKTPSYNLWTERWITVERLDGSLEQLGLEEALLQAEQLKGLYDTSPLVVVGIHRLLTAILQDALNIQHQADLGKVWREGRFSREAIEAFGKQFEGRFDLFSEKEPFLQSADLPLAEGKEDKPVGYLFPEMPTATNITHYNHGHEDERILCAACAGRGLVCIPAFATSGGSGIKPSINGVPPIYVIPGGVTLFESLAFSLLRPAYFPEMASKEADKAWWRREARVGKSSEAGKVGYLHSLTFPARRVRLHPILTEDTCSRCGKSGDWMVRRMVFAMGESRPKENETWLDPFAAYRLKENKPPIPIRPGAGKAMWREYAALFLRGSSKQAKGGIKSVRPRVLEQMSELLLEMGEDRALSLRCVGLRTDMKAKVFEWVEGGFDVPTGLLAAEEGGWRVQRAIDLASECAWVIGSTFAEVFRGNSLKSERFRLIRSRMVDAYWGKLGDVFREYVLGLDLNETDKTRKMETWWAEQTVRAARGAFREASEQLPEKAADLAKRVEGEEKCERRLNHKRKEFLE